MAQGRNVQEVLDEQDLALIHALQVAPRISWAQAGHVLGASPAALADRWARLRGSGLAWVTAHVNASRTDLIVAFVEVDCLPEARPDVVRHLCQDPRAVTVEEAARGRDLQVTVMVRDLRALTRFVLDDLPRVHGVRQTRSRLATGLQFEASRWRLDVLEPAQVRSLGAIAGRHSEEPGTTPPRDPWPLIEALAVDGRLTASELARRTGRNAATVRRQLPRLLASGLLTFRCDVSQLHVRRPVSCNWLARVPVEEQARTIQAVATLPELRLCVSTTGETNVMLTAWTRSLTDLLALERLMGERLPWLALMDSSVTLRVAKRMGWLLDDEGRCTGEVVVNRLEI
ncbi:Lrp/AsnC family transcriptional regulator [Blastococcus mobilis]|uniref:Transcriptional regulator, AsnC family n=1 Tax=Blastococcus mobilis TaxID=1938746 RepID=A0A239A8E5_9ACTN|nr:Lrp/AsnC family transcriptional regulator [Blastococcus mobilis]SNR91905.1 transcriptional regulator, AsnC family [Blastococcus mobilis]